MKLSSAVSDASVVYTTASSMCRVYEHRAITAMYIDPATERNASAKTSRVPECVCEDVCARRVEWRGRRGGRLDRAHRAHNGELHGSVRIWRCDEVNTAATMNCPDDRKTTTSTAKRADTRRRAFC